MAYSNNPRRKTGVSGHPNYGIDDFLSDELPDYSSRRSSYSSPYAVEQKTTPLDSETERNRKISTASNRSTASNTLEVPRPGSLDRQNSFTSTSSLVSNSSVRTFSYQNFRRPKIRNTFGCSIILFGLCLLVVGICLMIFGVTSSSNSQSDVTTSTNDTSKSDPNVPQTDPHANACKTIGYFALFSGILVILIGISIIFCIQVDKKPNPQQDNKNKLERRVSTIEIEPPVSCAETAITKPEIMITTDNFQDDVSYRKFPTSNFIMRPKISIDESPDPNISTEIQRRFVF